MKAIVFCTNIAHCHLMSEKFNVMGYSSIALTGENNTGERIKAFKDLQDPTNHLEMICTVDILNEGVDIPAVNMVLFLRPTESSTIFLQQLGRGLRKYPNKDYLTVLDFIGNDYKRSVQIALALGTLGKTTYVEKAYLKQLILSDFKQLDVPGVIIDIDELSKKEMIRFINEENFNKSAILKKDYVNFKKYLNTDQIPTHMDYLESEISPNLDRFTKSRIGSKRMNSYYSFLRYIKEENLPIFSDEEVKFINELEQMVPLVKVDEYIIVQYLLDHPSLKLEELIGYNSRVNLDSLKFAWEYLNQKKILEGNKLSLANISNIKSYLEDLLMYGLARYEREYGDFEGEYKLYTNYTKEQSMTAINKEFKMNIRLKGTYVESSGNTYIYVGLKKDKEKEMRTNYKDKFISPHVFQWESENNTTRTNTAGKKLLNTKKVFLFVRKMDEEDSINLPFTYFGTGILTNPRDSLVINQENGEEYHTLLFDILLDHCVPSDYHIDFEIPEQILI